MTGDTKARTLSALAYQAIAFERGEVRAHGVIGQPQSLCQFCHRAPLSSKKQENLSTRALKKPPRPPGDIHGEKITTKGSTHK